MEEYQDQFQKDPQEGETGTQPSPSQPEGGEESQVECQQEPQPVEKPAAPLPPAWNPGSQPGYQAPYQSGYQVPTSQPYQAGSQPSQQGNIPQGYRQNQNYPGAYQQPSWGNPYGQPAYGQAPYPAPYPPVKQRMPLGLKVFLYVLSVLAVGSLLGLGIATVYAKNTQSTPDYQEFYQQFEDEFGDYFGGLPDGYDDGNGIPPEYDDETPQIQDRDQLDLPDIEVEPYEQGITIEEKPSGQELSAQQVYEKVVPSTVSILAEIPLTDGTTESSSGTGIFVTSDGFILTNSHVVGNTKSALVMITTHDGSEYPAVVVGLDKTTDLAILKTEDHGFTPAEFGNADELSIGEWVIAIGNPGGSAFSGSLTRGVISGLDREVGEYSSNGMTYIQTDAAINPGNSGGPLVNMYGQVVGINSSKVVAQYYEGMGFAIPVSDAKSIIDQLLSEGYVAGRTRLGITAQNMLYGSPAGVRIVEMEEGSSFSGTEAQVGDIITEVDGTQITSLSSLSNKLLEYQPGDQITVTLHRPDTGEEIQVTATLLADNGETQG